MRKSNDKGYSLVEVLIGLLIFSVGALASGAMIIGSLHQNRVAREKSIVASLVSQRLEEIRSRPWFSLDGNPSLAAGGQVFSRDDLSGFSLSGLDLNYYDDFNAGLDGNADLSSHAPYFLVTWRIEDLTDSGLDFKRITIQGASFHWRSDQNSWEPISVFDHVAMVFREIKIE